ncbi:MAG: NlpC/P60 family protein, partial [Leptotrichiaceae bacterium]|nr:NlpC/P60 family protein [Leptotrichiaceae bacterium]
MSNNMEELLNFSNRKKVEKQSISSMDDLREKVVQNAQEVLKRRTRKNYVWGAKGPDYFDCSGFSKYVLKEAGLKIPDGSAAQSGYVKHDLKKEELKPGDLVFFDTPRNKGKVGHVGIYIGEGKFIDSGGGGSKNKSISNAGYGVRISNLNSKYWKGAFLGGASLEKIAVKNNIVTKSTEPIKRGIDTSDRTVIAENKEKLKKDTERFEKIFKYLTDVEGVYSNHKNDKGGATKYGIIEAEARKYGYKGNMRELPLETAKEIYKNKYFYGNKLDKINDDRVALSVCDWIVNSGSNG